MTVDPTGIGDAARALHEAYGALLSREAATGDSIEQTQAIEALDAARDRLRGGPRPGPDQLAFDVLLAARLLR